MKFLNWLKNHVVLVVGLLTLVITLVVGGSTILKSKIDYDEYSRKYDITTLNTKASSPAAPLSVSINDSFAKYGSNGKVTSTQSKYPAAFTAFANDFTVTPKDTTLEETVLSDGSGKLDSYIGGLNGTGGEIKLDFKFSANAYCDIEIVLESGWVSNNKPVEIDDLLYFSVLSINDQEIGGEIKLQVENEDGHNWHSLVLTGLALPKGENQIIIKDSPANTPKNSGVRIVPNVRNLTVYSEATVKLG